MTKTLQINIRVTPEQKQLIKDKASKMGLAISSYLLMKGLKYL